MGVEHGISPLDVFEFEGQKQPLLFVETQKVVPNVVDCDVYRFVGDRSKDLGIIRVEPGGRTPRQRVLQGERTVEGWRSGRGKLRIERADGQEEVYEVGGEGQKPFTRDIQIGEVMRWEADPGSKLEAYEVCFPPYEDGRYKNLLE